MSPLRWTCKSTARLAEELTQQAHPIGAWTVGALLRADGYSLRERALHNGQLQPSWVSLLTLPQRREAQGRRAKKTAPGCGAESF
jgi:Rhodopirellula transposase DDE domain